MASGRALRDDGGDGQGPDQGLSAMRDMDLDAALRECASARGTPKHLPQCLARSGAADALPVRTSAVEGLGSRDPAHCGCYILLRMGRALAPSHGCLGASLTHFWYSCTICRDPTMEQDGVHVPVGCRACGAR